MTKTITTNTGRIARGVLRVGGGRGFVVNSRNTLGHEERLVITAAHCLPFIPPPHPMRHIMERTYRNLLGPLSRRRTVWAECVFVDTMADVAVLRQPDNQALCEQAAAYDHLVDGLDPMLIANAPLERRRVRTLSIDSRIRYSVPGHGHARALSLRGQWYDIDVWRRGGYLGSSHHFRNGMSGSPIINANGAAIGLVSTGDVSPVIVGSLSVQLLRAIRAGRRP